MILPKEIKTKNKIRDAQILSLYLNENLTTYEIGQQFNLTHQRISSILYKNRELLKYDKQYEKAKRINALHRMAEKYDGVLGKKSSIDIHEQLRKEIEGEKSLVELHEHKTFVYLDNKAKEENAETVQQNRITSELPAV